MFWKIFLLALCVASAATFIVLRVKKAGAWALFSKLIASAIFVMSGLLTLYVNQTLNLAGIFFVLGLFCGMIGDVLLELKEVYTTHMSRYLNAGFLSFGIGHGFYMAALSLIAAPVKKLWLPILVALTIGTVIAMLIVINSGSLGVDFGKHKIQAIAYSIVLCITFVYALTLFIMITELWLLALAFLYFLISDLVLSLLYFAKKKSAGLQILNLAFYYASQIMIVAFMMFML